ncbi:hypothetical protein SDC9_152955 [bioreactor metagenome]|uniref:Uncharacterized protein n=1 Tax=bioreactor metagenome TaxID=1076179 RepID=A0A645EWV2_9ZZZZ
MEKTILGVKTKNDAVNVVRIKSHLTNSFTYLSANCIDPAPKDMPTKAVAAIEKPMDGIYDKDSAVIPCWCAANSTAPKDATNDVKRIPPKFIIRFSVAAGMPMVKISFASFQTKRRPLNFKDRLVCLKYKIYRAITAPTIWEITKAHAAPTKPKAGIPNFPNISG